MQSFEIDKRTGQLFIKKGASLDVNHLNGESIVFSVEVSWANGFLTSVVSFFQETDVEQSSRTNPINHANIFVRLPMVCIQHCVT